MRTDKLFSLHSFITVTWFEVYAWLSSLRSTMSYYSLWLCLQQTADSKGCLVDLLLTVAKLPPPLEACGIKSRTHPNKTLLHCAPFFMREFVALTLRVSSPAHHPKNNKECRSLTRVHKTGEAAQGRVTPATKLGGVGQARRFLNAKNWSLNFSNFLLKPPLPIIAIIGTCPCLTPSLATAPTSSLYSF